MEKNELIDALKRAKETSQKRNFNQSIDLIINLRGLDFKKQENQLDLFVNLHYGRGKKVSVCSLIGPELEPQSKEILNELLSSLILCDTGTTRLSAKILERQVKKYKTQENKIMDVLDRIKKEAYEIKDQLIRGNIKNVGEILDQTWQYKKMLDNKISNNKLDQVYQGVKNEGAIGGKLLGAGAGGHFLFLCEPEKKPDVVKQIIKKNCKVIYWLSAFIGLPPIV